MNRVILYLTALALCLGLGASEAQAIPVLQLYLEGGTYDSETETWVITPPGSSAGEPFRLWAIGNIAGPGGKGDITSARLSIAYDRNYSGLSVSLTSSQAGGLGVGEYDGFTDPSEPVQPTLNYWVQTSKTGGAYQCFQDGIVDDGGRPVLGDGKNLPPHGVFGADTVWLEYSLGDFASPPDSPVGDFIGSFPTEVHSGGQINVYEVSVIGGSGATVHFDLYNTVRGASRAKFAPFSHDADGEAYIIPEPASVAVWSLLGLIGIAVTCRRRRGQRATQCR